MHHFRLLSYVILSSHSLRFWCERYEIQHIDIVMSQAIYESGHTPCKNCALSEFNNLFGFTNENGYIYFGHWSESVLFYKGWQERNYKGGDYYECLSKNWYAFDMEKYIRTIKQIKVR